LHLKSWLNDTPVLYDALEIVAEKYRTLWWGQQLDLAMIPWSMLLSIEGHRRKIPHLWAYALLPHLVSLSFAQNLFYVALLLTPSPIVTAEEPDRYDDPVRFAKCMLLTARQLVGALPPHIPSQASNMDSQAVLLHHQLDT